MPTNHFVVINQDTARFECTFGRGCDGVCCSKGRVLLAFEETSQIDRAFPDVLPLMRSSARAAVERSGYVTKRWRLRVEGGWCVFFNKGCTLHKVGESRGNKFAHKPLECALFPLYLNARGNWYVRQKGYEDESADLFCLTPSETTPRAAETSTDEWALAARISRAAGG